MLAIQGYFQSGRFVTDSPVQIPERKKTIVTVLDENIDEAAKLEAHKKLWREITEGLRNCDEPLEGEPERIRFSRTAEDLDAL